jgi:hypothetical protein
MDIDRPSHMMPSTRPLAITVTSEEEEGDEIDDDRTLAEVIKGKSLKTSEKGASSLGGDLLPNHPKGPRAATRSVGLVLLQVALKMRYPGEPSFLDLCEHFCSICSC